LGTIWDKPFAQVVVRPTRYTFKFINEYDTFTLCGFGEEHRSAMNLIGSKSGRVCDKIKESGLTVVPSQVVAAPCFAEAQLVLECRKIYWQDFDPTHFLSPDIPTKYPQRITTGCSLAKSLPFLELPNSPQDDRHSSLMFKASHQ